MNIIGCYLLLMFVSVHYMKAQDNIITFDIGNFSVTLLSEGQGQGRPDILIGATEAMKKQAIPDGTFPIATNVFLIEMNGKNYLIDAGYGQKTVQNLEVYGKKPSDIDAIFLTHFHGDHIGSLLLYGIRTYTKASLYISKPEYDYYTNDEIMNSLPENRRGSIIDARKIFEAYKDKLTVFTPNEIENTAELVPGLRSVAAYGHTPGHTSFLIESESQKLLFWGDLTHAMAIQMPFPQVAVSYDTDPQKAIEYRQKLLKYLAPTNIRVAGAHIQSPAIGLIKQDGSTGYIFSPLCDCEGRTP